MNEFDFNMYFTLLIINCMSTEVLLQLQKCVDVKRQIKSINKKRQQQYWKLICDNRDKVRSWSYVSENINVTPKLVMDNPNEKWDWSKLCTNPTITLEFLEQNLHKPLWWEGISRRVDLTEAFIDKYPNNRWDWYSIAGNRNISLAKIMYYTDMSRYKLWYYTIYNNSYQDSNASWETINKYRWTIISRSVNLTMDIINGLSECSSGVLPEILSDNFLEEDGRKSLSTLLSDIQRYKLCINDIVWDWREISMNAAITLQDVDDNPHKPWVYNSRIGHESGWTPHSLSSNPNLTMTYINKHLDKGWNWAEVSANSAITMDDIDNNPHIPWASYVDHIVENPNITVSMYNKYTDPTILSQSDWLNRYFCVNPNVTIKDMEAHASKGWSWWYFSFNPNLTIEYVRKHINDIKWSWDGICKNAFTGDYYDQLIVLNEQHKIEIQKLVKAYYWLCISSMSLPPVGYYFLNDLRNIIPDTHKPIFDELRRNRNYEQIKLLYLL